jgi:hypothetical protein
VTEWRDISTAPKDGKDILVYCEETKEQIVAFFQFGGWQFATASDGERIVCSPSKWMPLPDPPEDTK